MIDFNNGHHRACRCIECASGDVPMTDHNGRRLDLRTVDPSEFERQVSLAEREFEARMYRDRG
jgi:hypothetical protein